MSDTILVLIISSGVCFLLLGALGLALYLYKRKNDDDDIGGGDNPEPEPGGGNPKPSPGNPKPSPGNPQPSPGEISDLGELVKNPRTVNGNSVDPENKGRFYTACYGTDDGHGGEGAFDNTLIMGPPLWSIALPRGRPDKLDVDRQNLITDKSDTGMKYTTDFNHPLVSPQLSKNGTWTHDEEYTLMKEPADRPVYLMVEADGTQKCVRVDDKCLGCYWGDRGINGNQGFDIDIYTSPSDANCWQTRPNQWVQIYRNSPLCNK